MTANSYHYYAFDAALLLETCLGHLQRVVELDTQGSHTLLYEVKEALVNTERLLQDYFLQILQATMVENGSYADNRAQLQNQLEDKYFPSLGECVKELRILMDQKRSKEHDKPAQRHPRLTKLPCSSGKHAKTGRSLQHQNTTLSRSATDTLLFRLIVALQLCLVRIDDAHFVIAGFRRGSGDDSNNVATSLRRRRRRKWVLHIGFCGGVLGITSFLLQRDRKHGKCVETKEGLQTLAKVGTSALLCFQLVNQWQSVWMTSKLVKSTTEIEDWQQQWLLVEYSGSTRHLASKSPPLSSNDDKSQRLIEYAKSQSPNFSSSSSFWISQGELRFIIVRKALEAYYSLTGTDDVDTSNENQKLPSYFRDLMQHSWGLVSRPAFKSFSLKATQLLRGASVADRIEIAGVPCFVISRHPCPELAAAIQRYHRKDRRRLSFQLSTIDEHESAPSSPSAIPKKLFAGTNDRYRQQDVILHCTGGGFFFPHDRL